MEETELLDHELERVVGDVVDPPVGVCVEAEGLGEAHCGRMVEDWREEVCSIWLCRICEEVLGGRWSRKTGRMEAVYRGVRVRVRCRSGAPLNTGSIARECVGY